MVYIHKQNNNNIITIMDDFQLPKTNYYRLKYIITRHPEQVVRLLWNFKAYKLPKYKANAITEQR